MISRGLFLAAALSSVALIAWAAEPAPAPRLRFAILGDRTGGSGPGIYERVLREVAALSPDFAINVGDAIERRCDVPTALQWKSLREQWRAAAMPPLYLVPGNHDISSPESLQAFLDQTRRPQPYYSFTIGGFHAVVLDNSRDWEISDEQIRFLDRDLSRNAAAPVKAVFFHKPYWVKDVTANNMTFPLHAVARRHGVRYIFSGHGHQLVHQVRDGVHYIEVGSAGGGIDEELKTEGFRGGWFYQFLWATLDGSELKLTVRELPPPFGQGRTFPLDEWTAGGPAFQPEDLARQLPLDKDNRKNLCIEPYSAH